MILYIIKSIKYNKTYTGITENILRRLSEHNLRKDKYTSRYSPWILIYAEDCSDMQSARKREKYFKSCAGRKVIARILDNRE